MDHRPKPLNVENAAVEQSVPDHVAASVLDRFVSVTVVTVVTLLNVGWIAAICWAIWRVL